MAGPYVLSESALAALSALLERENARASNAGNGDPSRTGDGEQPAPETYVVRTPTDGIPGLTPAVGTAPGDEPGSADCDVYQLDGDPRSLLATPATRLVHNLSTAAAPGDAWALATRDKFGKWWLVGFVGDDRYCHNNLAALQTSDCLTATLTDSTGGGDEVTMIWNGVNPWVSLTDLTYFGVAGKLVFLIDDGRLRLWLTLPPTGSGSYGAYADLIDCGDGCWMGGPLTGHLPASGNPACEGDTFTICLACGPCETYTVPCCPSNPLPGLLYLTVTGSTNGCDGQYYLYYDPSIIFPKTWSTLAGGPPNQVGDCSSVFSFRCLGSGMFSNEFQIYMTGSTSPSQNMQAAPTSCSPFSVTFGPTVLSGGDTPCECGVGTYFTVSESP